MKQYIEKSAVVAEIERLIKYDEMVMNHDAQITELLSRELNTLYELSSFVNTLEVKEVDLEKEIKEQIDKYYENCNKKLEEMGEYDNDISFLTLDGFARHFYELGFKAKGE